MLWSNDHINFEEHKKLCLKLFLHTPSSGWISIKKILKSRVLVKIPFWTLAFLRKILLWTQACFEKKTCFSVFSGILIK